MIWLLVVVSEAQRNLIILMYLLRHEVGHFVPIVDDENL